MDYNLTKASKVLQCNETCVNYAGKSEDKTRVVCMKDSLPIAVPKPPADCHSLKGYTGTMGKISCALAYAEQYNREHTPKDARDDKRGKSNVS